MKFLKIFTIAIIAFSLASCGSKNNQSEEDKSEESKGLTPETTKIKGDLGDYFEVVDKDYILTKDGIGVMVSVEVKRTDTEYAFDPQGVEDFGVTGDGIRNAGFGIELLDENNNVIEKKAATRGMYSRDDIKEALKLKPGETGTVRWEFYLNEDQKPVKFRLTSAYDDHGFSSSSGEISSAGYESVSSSGSGNWDAMLDSYDSYVTKYISYMKRAMNGDASALSEYPALMEKAEEFSNKMANAQGEMTSAQWARYTKITNKMMQAASEM